MNTLKFPIAFWHESQWSLSGARAVQSVDDGRLLAFSLVLLAPSSIQIQFSDVDSRVWLGRGLFHAYILVHILEFVDWHC